MCCTIMDKLCTAISILTAGYRETTETHGMNKPEAKPR